jgi:hypothetical protein|tara:strand:+ start:41 stop:259 length:219 start_codon:yes stop_codon:yes gene_type:complete
MDKQYKFGRQGAIHLIEQRMKQLSRDKKHRKKIDKELKDFGKIPSDDEEKQIEFFKTAIKNSKKEMKKWTKK